MRMSAGIVLLVLAQVMAGCGDSPSPWAPSRVPPVTTGGQVAGIVYDTAFRPLAGARVEIVDGPEAGKSTVADGKGQFLLNLTGTFDDTTRFRASNEGHIAAIATRGPRCAACTPNWWIYFNLAVLAAPVNLAGDYTLTFIADSSCANLPNEARTRTYAATIALAAPSHYPADTHFDVALSGPPFLESHKTFPLHVAGDYVAGWLGDLHGSPGLVEKVAANSYFTLAGAVEASVTVASTISATLDGAVDFCVLNSEWGSRYSCSSGEVVTRAQCVSQKHQLILTRR